MAARHRNAIRGQPRRSRDALERKPPHIPSDRGPWRHWTKQTKPFALHQKRQGAASNAPHANYAADQASQINRNRRTLRSGANGPFSFALSHGTATISPASCTTRHDYIDIKGAGRNAGRKAQDQGARHAARRAQNISSSVSNRAPSVPFTPFSSKSGPFSPENK
jgi:hypothetical protein